MEVPSPLERRVVGALVRAVFMRDRRAGPWPVPDGLRHEAFTLVGNSGAEVAARWFPARDARGAVVLAHPDRRYGQHWFVREGWVPLLLQARLHVLTFDFPGYGGSRGGSTYFAEDVLAAAQAASDRAPGVPLHAVGVSMGAFAVANASPRLDAEGLALESPYPDFNSWYGSGWGLWAMRAFDAAFPRTAALIDATANLPRARAARVLVAAPGGDRITPPRLSREVADAGPPGRTRYLELPGLGHLELFGRSARYREAVLEALGVPEDEASALARPAEIPRPSEPREARGPAPTPLAPPARR